MLDMQTITQYVQDFGVVDFEALDEDSICFRGKDLTQIIIKTMKNKPVFTVWGGDDYQEVLDSTSLPSIETLHAYLEEHAMTSKSKNETTQTTENADTSMIDIYVNIIKEKLAEQQILRPQTNPSDWLSDILKTNWLKSFNFYNNSTQSKAPDKNLGLYCVG